LGWTQTPSGWYYLDTDSGIMQTGWKKDAAGHWYFLNTAKGAAEGIMLTGWNWIDGYCYYFNSQSGPDQGKLLVNTTTPDGYKVNADGKWEKDGKVVLNTEINYDKLDFEKYIERVHLSGSDTLENERKLSTVEDNLKKEGATEQK